MAGWKSPFETTFYNNSGKIQFIEKKGLSLVKSSQVLWNNQVFIGTKQGFYFLLAWFLLNYYSNRSDMPTLVHAWYYYAEETHMKTKSNN